MTREFRLSSFESVISMSLILSFCVKGDMAQRSAASLFLFSSAAAFSLAATCDSGKSQRVMAIDGDHVISSHTFSPNPCNACLGIIYPPCLRQFNLKEERSHVTPSNEKARRGHTLLQLVLHFPIFEVQWAYLMHGSTKYTIIAKYGTWQA